MRTSDSNPLLMTAYLMPSMMRTGATLLVADSVPMWSSRTLSSNFRSTLLMVHSSDGLASSSGSGGTIHAKQGHIEFMLPRPSPSTAKSNPPHTCIMWRVDRYQDENDPDPIDCCNVVATYISSIIYKQFMSVLRYDVVSGHGVNKCFPATND